MAADSSPFFVKRSIDASRALTAPTTSVPVTALLSLSRDACLLMLNFCLNRARALLRSCLGSPSSVGHHLGDLQWLFSRLRSFGEVIVSRCVGRASCTLGVHWVQTCQTRNGTCYNKLVLRRPWG